MLTHTVCIYVLDTGPISSAMTEIEHAVLSAVGVLSAVQYEKVFNDYELH